MRWSNFVQRKSNLISVSRYRKPTILFHLLSKRDIFYIYYAKLFQDYIWKNLAYRFKWTICLHARTHRYVRIILEIILNCLKYIQNAITWYRERPKDETRVEKHASAKRKPTKTRHERIKASRGWKTQKWRRSEGNAPKGPDSTGLDCAKNKRTTHSAVICRPIEKYIA